MGFMNFGKNVNGAVDLHAVPAGEYNVRITHIASWPAETPEDEMPKALILRMEIIDDPYAKELSCFLNLPGSAETEKQENQIANRLKAFYEAFDLDPESDYNPTERQEDGGWVGCEGWVLVDDPVDDGKGYGEQNKVKKFVSGN